MTAKPAADLPIAIVGAGFSGTLLMINLLRLGARVVLVERSREMLARGLAYGTRRPEHLLNVRAANMSAFPDDPNHFLRWMGFSDAEQANRFVPRLAYGQYLRELMMAAIAAAPDRVWIKEQEAVAIEDEGGLPVLRLDSGEVVKARGVVLALGNFPPTPIPELADLPSELVLGDPWTGDGLQALAGLESVLLLGTGLTAVDVALSLDRAGYRGRIIALSRRGLTSRAHAATGPDVGAVPRPIERGSWLLHRLRQRAREVGWRHAVDELRPHTQSLWRLHDFAAQTRFLRHARPWWDVHRHRLAPAVADRVDALQAEGRLSFVAGRIVEAGAEDGGARITLRRRGQEATETLSVDRIINCTGPEGDITRAAPPLLAGLLVAGRARPDAHRLGLEVDHIGRVVDAAGHRQERLLAVGPITRGEAWETIAVPDIRRQVWDLARYLAPAPAAVQAQLLEG
jgi:uncharacterized NAD(P)/FAD-binding protein YdhS